MPLPTRTHSSKSKKGVTLVHDTPYEAAYSAFRLALQDHLGEGVACWVDAEDIDIQSHSGDSSSGQASGTARYKTLSDDGKRVAPRKDCTWSLTWKIDEGDGRPTTVLSDYTIT